jgi:hypothetical protein
MSDLSSTSSFKIPHLVIFQAPGQMPLRSSAKKIAEELLSLKGTFRDWYLRAVSDPRVDHNHFWIHGHLFVAWIEDQRRPNDLSSRDHRGREGYCLHCNKIVPIPDEIVRHIKGQRLTRGRTVNREDEMVELQNYRKITQFLKHLEEVQQVSKTDLDRYSLYLIHMLIWAYGRALGDSPEILPALPAYTASQSLKTGKPILALESQEKIIEISKRFFIWAKATYPNEFTIVTLGWIDSLRPLRSL